MNYSLEDLNSKEFWLDFGADGFSIVKEDLQEAVDNHGKHDFDKALFQEEGYLHLKDYLDLDWNKYIPLLKKLHDNDLPCVFAFLYDEFWQIHNHLQDCVSSFLDEKSALLATPWIWYVDPKKEKEILSKSKNQVDQELQTRSMFSGFYGPHRDKGSKALFADGSPKILSFWMPMTSANPLNSCIYIVPADRDPTYGTPEDTSWLFKRADIRALPAEPGDVLFWNEAVLHWGSRPALRDDVEPRLSIGFEYIKSDFRETCYPHYDFGYYPDFKTRLAIIATQFKLYLTEEGFPEIFIDFVKANDSIIKNSSEKL